MDYSLLFAIRRYHCSKTKACPYTASRKLDFDKLGRASFNDASATASKFLLKYYKRNGNEDEDDNNIRVKSIVSNQGLYSSNQNYCFQVSIIDYL